MRKRLLRLAAVAAVLGVALLGLARGSLAQDAKPMVTVSFSGYDALVSDIELIGKVSGNANLPKLFDQIVKGSTQGQGLAGLDTKRPWGLVVLGDPSGQPSGYGFLPVTDLKQLLLALKAMGLENEDAGGGLYKVSRRGENALFVKQQGEWAFVAPAAELLASLPSDPVALLGGLEKRYDVAVQAHMDNVPDPLKQMMLSQVEAGMRMNLGPMSSGTGDQAILHKQVEEQINWIKTVLGDLQTAVLGLSIDDKTQTAYVDVELTAKPGSKTAEEFGLYQNGKSRFAGFALPEAALSGLEVRKLSPREIAQATANLQNARARLEAALDTQDLPEAEATKVKQMVADFMAILEETIKAGEADGGASVLLGPAAATVVSGGQVADGAKADKLVRDIVAAVVADSPEVAPMIKLDAGKLDGITLHTLSLPIPADMPNRAQVVQLVGETFEVVVGTDAKSVYLAAGRDAMGKLKASIEQSKAQAGKEVPPSRFSLALAPILQFAASMIEEPMAKQMATMLASSLAQAGSDTHLTGTVSPVANGLRGRLEIEKGLLGALGQAAGMLVMMHSPQS